MKNYVEYLTEKKTVRVQSINGWHLVSEETIIIDCSNIRMEILPELPTHLVKLNCSNNYLKELPELPITLKQLNCCRNQITELPFNLDTLNQLYCDYNPLECLIPEKFYSLQTIEWLRKYLQKIETYDFQKNLLTRDPNQIEELIKRNIIHSQIREEFPDLIDSVEWGWI